MKTKKDHLNYNSVDPWKEKKNENLQHSNNLIRFNPMKERFMSFQVLQNIIRQVIASNWICGRSKKDFRSFLNYIFTNRNVTISLFNFTLFGEDNIISVLQMKNKVEGIVTWLQSLIKSIVKKKLGWDTVSFKVIRMIREVVSWQRIFKALK